MAANERFGLGDAGTSAYPYKKMLSSWHDRASVFSTREFVESWCRSHGDCSSFVIPVHGSGPDRTMHMVRKSMRFGSCEISSGSPQYWASPGWVGELEVSAAEDILKQLRGPRVRSWQWQVRFDHEPLAKMLSSFGVSHSRSPLCILDLDKSYEGTFARYHTAAREGLERTARTGVSVRNTCNTDDMLAYQSIASDVARNESHSVALPSRMIFDLIKCPDLAHFSVAEYAEEIIGGLFCLRDGNSICALHIAYDQKYVHLVPDIALYDDAIRWACESGADFFNFLQCGPASTEQRPQAAAAFKAFWGGRIESNWCFSERNLFWKNMSAAKVKMSQIRNSRKRLADHEPDAQAIDSQLVAGLTWAERAETGGLRAVCYRYASKSKNTLVHGASSWAADKALSFTRKRDRRQPIVLDLGCGNGRLVRHFGQRNCSVIGLDITFEMLQNAKQHDLCHDSFFALYDGLSLPVKDRAIDLVWSCGVLKYMLLPPGSPCLGKTTTARDEKNSHSKRFVPTYAKLAKEMYRVIKPGGLMVNYEMWVDESPELFIPGFRAAGFALERIAVVRREHDRLEGLFDGRFDNQLGQRLAFHLAQLSALLRYHFDDPMRGGEFVDYLFFWRRLSDQMS